MGKKSLGLIGVGAFGAFAATHLTKHLDLVLCDVSIDIEPFAKTLSARSGDLSMAAACDIVVLAVPIQKLAAILADISPHLKPTTVVIDVASVKMKPLQWMADHLPPHIGYVGTHPLFGPQSGKDGIEGLNIAICEGRGGHASCVAHFCRETLGLKVFEVSAEDHDREAASVQGLTHMLAKIVVALDLPTMRFPTKTYELMQQMIEMVRYDSEALFRAIERENPFVEDTKKAFFKAARQLEEQLSLNYD
jgi:prephenate dehydrogenase